MESEKDTEKESEIWYAMRATYRREPDAMRLLEKKEKMGCFVPMQYKISLKKGKKVRVLVPVVHNLLFCPCLSFGCEACEVPSQLPAIHYRYP